MECTSHERMPAVFAAHLIRIVRMPSKVQQNAALQRKKALTHHPQMGTVGKREGASAFTFVNVF